MGDVQADAGFRVECQQRGDGERLDVRRTRLDVRLQVIAAGRLQLRCVMRKQRVVLRVRHAQPSRLRHQLHGPQLLRRPGQA